MSTAIKKHIPLRLLLLSLALAFSSFFMLNTQAVSFSDISDTAWYAEAANYVAEHGYMTGTSDTLFSPNETISRATVAVVLWRLEGSPSTSTTSTFPDVAADAWYGQAIHWCSSVGIAAGYSNGTFQPNTAVTREQLGVFLFRYAKYKHLEQAQGVLTIYSDHSLISTWAVEGMKHTVGTGLITGNNEGKLKPRATTTRAELAVILQRMLTPVSG